MQLYSEGLQGRMEECGESITECCIEFRHPHFYHGLKSIRESSEKSCKKENVWEMCYTMIGFNLFSSSERQLRGDLIMVSKYFQGGDF